MVTGQATWSDMQERKDVIGVVCADVDGTVLQTDLLYESLLFALKRHPSVLFLVPFWLLRGLPYLKAQLARRAADMSVAMMPINESVVSYLQERSESGSSIVLASASHTSLVAKVGERLGFVSRVIGSDESVNCKGSRKAEAIVAQLGDVQWEYVGDSRADLDVWRRAASVVCVSDSIRFAEQVRREFPKVTFLEKGRWNTATLAKALRVHQWLKNALVFLPLLLAHQWGNAEAILGSLVAAVSFSCCASGVYLLNDLLDLEADRQHPRKRKRPCASGELPLTIAMGLAPILFVLGFLIAGLASPSFMAILALYLLLTTAYSFRLKALALVDIILLAILYTIRIVGGGVAAGVTVSQWLLGLSMFLFLSLACIKRFSELLVLQQRNENRTWGRGYSVGDIEQVASFGSASGYISVLVLALYVSSHEVVKLYPNPQVIWLACPLLLYWISRIWLLARRGLVHDDPLVFALRDRVTYVVGFLGMLIFLGAKFAL
jgi:4-hydroxybenzoate polyprenyltransferase/3-deoxy-D-manno-octulosonate 8-phosphate phosphatase KdsC-like HAD superfamily phosphatase